MVKNKSEVTVQWYKKLWGLGQTLATPSVVDFAWLGFVWFELNYAIKTTNKYSLRLRSVIVAEADARVPGVC